MNRRFAALSLLLALPACRDAEPFDDPSQPIEVAAGSAFEVAVESNQSTGFQWVLVDSAGLGPLVSAGWRYEVPWELRDHSGAGGTETWTFRASAAGEGVISLVNIRPWEKTPPTDTTRFRVTVR